MSSDLTLRPLAPLVDLPALAEQAQSYADQSRAPATVRAYRADWRHFAVWCADQQLPTLPAAPETVALYVTALAQTHRYSTIQRRISAIAQAHHAQQLDSPTSARIVREVLGGIRRAVGTAQQGKAPAVTAAIQAMVATLDDSPSGVRDRALLLIGFAGAFRRSELVSLDVADCRFDQAGLTITLRRSKTDQEGHGALVAIPHGRSASTCPVRALRAWLTVASIASGPIFRGIDRHGTIKISRLCDRAVAKIVKRCAAAAGLDAAQFAGHSLRAGLATAAAQAGVEERVIMKQTRHVSVAMVRKYIREGDLFRENAAGNVGL